MSEQESVLRWWFQYVIVPILGAGGVIAIVLQAVISSTKDPVPDSRQREQSRGANGESVETLWSQHISLTACSVTRKEEKDGLGPTVSGLHVTTGYEGQGVVYLSCDVSIPERVTQARLRWGAGAVEWGSNADAIPPYPGSGGGVWIFLTEASDPTSIVLERRPALATKEKGKPISSWSEDTMLIEEDARRATVVLAINDAWGDQKLDVTLEKLLVEEVGAQ